MPGLKNKLRYGQYIRSLKWFGETSKWLLGGFTAILFFTYDKINCRGLRIAEMIIGFLGIACFFITYTVYARISDKLQEQLDARQEAAKLSIRSRRVFNLTWDRDVRRVYIFGFGMLLLYAFLFFVINQFFCPPPEVKPQQTITNNYYANDSCSVIPGPPLPPATGGIILHNVFFDFDSATLRRRSLPELDSLARVLKANPARLIEISAFTDDRGSFEYNLDLSNRRARAVVDYLISQGISASRMQSRGYSKLAPVESNATDAGRDANRRVEFKVLRN